jgi:hypothetical protein
MQYLVRHHEVLSFLPDSRRPVHELRFPIATALALAALGKAAAWTPGSASGRRLKWKGEASTSRLRLHRQI